MLKRSFHFVTLASVLLSMFMVNVSPAFASTTYTVDSTGDAAPDGICGVLAGDCTLRDAVSLANSDVANDTINITITGTITLSQGQFSILQPVQIIGPGKDNLTIDASDLGRLFGIQTSGAVGISGMSLTHGYSGAVAADGGAILLISGSLTIDDMSITYSKTGANGTGGAIIVYNGQTLKVTNTILDNNSAGFGGGGALYIYSDASLTMQNTVISNNTATNGSTNGWGGGININGTASPSTQMTLDRVYITNNHAIGTSAAYGGGIYMGDYANLKITRSTISGNDAAQSGAGIYASGTGLATPNLDISNTTIRSNILLDTTTGRVGAGMSITGNATLNNVTIVDNNATLNVTHNSLGGGVYFDNLGAVNTMDVKNSIIANNIADAGAVCYFYNFTSIKNSLLEEQGCGATNGVNGNIIGLDPLLGAIQQDIQFPTVLFYPLTLASPALDTGDDATCISADPRGITRPQGPHCDIGAVEYDVIPAVTSITRASADPTSASSVDFAVTFSESITGVDLTDFNLTTSSVSSATVSGVSGSGSTYTVSVNTGVGSGTLRLDLSDNDSIKDSSDNPLGDTGIGNGNFTSGQVYTINKPPIFADVPFNYWANSYIERLYSAGITGGCTTTPLNYCPDSSVTRAQMAIFLLKGIHGSSYTPPAVGVSTGFTDVPTDYWAAAWIKQLAAEGITGGCGPGVYCPDATVTRAQMAVFLLKAKHGSSYNPPTPTGIFTDVPLGYWADKWIEQLAAEGVTSGCGIGIYCPDSDVTRAQMAVFLVKNFNLP